MKKIRAIRATTFLLSGLTAFCLAVPPLTARAETYYGDDGWKVVFTSDKKMESTFNTKDINDVVGGMQPGDNVVITLDLKNEHKAADWYMKNEVLYSLEDRSANKETGGGAYTYRLVYTDKDGKEDVLFDSDTVGGEGAADITSRMGEGLKGATNALKNYFYLDTLKKGEGGRITLEVALDGETQGNDYQTTLADLEMNFAVEMRATPPGTDRPESHRTYPDPPDHPGTPQAPTSSTSGTGIVQTSDDNNILLYTVLCGVSGFVLLLFCICSFRVYKRQREEA